MKRKILTTLALCMSLAMPITFARPTQAATVKLNKSAITIYKGKTYKLKVSGTKAKVKWTSSNKKIATVTSTGTVKGIKKGTAYVNAKVGSKTLKCKVTVKEKEATVTVKKVSYELKDTGDGVVAILTNKNTLPIEVKGTLVYFNNSGAMLEAVSDLNWCLEPNATCVFRFSAPYDTNDDLVPYADYELNLNVAKSTIETYGAKKLKVESNIGANNVTAKIINNSKKHFEYIHATVVFFDSDGNAMGYGENSLYGMNSGDVKYESFDLPEEYNENDGEYHVIMPASYKIYIDYACTY